MAGADRLPDRTFVVAAAAAFPPFWSLILHGQVTVIPLIAFWAGWRALEHRRHWLAGVAFGLLAIKPQFGIPLAVVVLACGEWAMMAGALTSLTAQAAAVWLMLGSEAFTAFAANIPMTIAYTTLLEPKPFMSHSLRTLTRLMPGAIALPMWCALVAIVLWFTVRAWRSQSPVRVRLGVVVLAATLVNPHLFIYDLTVLALPLIWFGSYVEDADRRHQAGLYWTAVYWLFVFTFMPTAVVIGLQASVFVMVGVLVFVSRAIRSDERRVVKAIDAPLAA